MKVRYGKPSIMNGRKRIFTLVELLIVVAIIAILAALLLPALRKAIDKARSVSCISHHKQFGNAFAMYANDYQDNIPTVGNNPFKLKNNDSSNPCGLGKLASYLGYTLEKDTKSAEYKKKMKLFTCPGRMTTRLATETDWMVDYSYWRDGTGTDSGNFAVATNALFVGKYGKIARRVLVLCDTSKGNSHFGAIPHISGTNGLYGNGSVLNIPASKYLGEWVGAWTLWPKLDRK